MLSKFRVKLAGVCEVQTCVLRVSKCTTMRLIIKSPILEMMTWEGVNSWNFAGVCFFNPMLSFQPPQNVELDGVSPGIECALLRAREKWNWVVPTPS